MSSLKENKTCVILDQYLNYLKIVKGRSPLTCDEYRIDCNMFFEFIKNQRNIPAEEISRRDFSDVDINFIKTITVADMYAFITYCGQERNLSVSSRARKIVSIRQLWKYLSITVVRTIKKVYNKTWVRGMEINNREIESEFNNLIMRMGKIFASESGFKMAQNYIKGLLSSIERKNGWQMAEYIGAATPYAIQQFLYRGRFSADEIRDKLREYVGEKLGEEGGVLVVDETGFLKQGKKSCGVKRQYSGTAGRIENCQIGVFLTYASIKGHCPIDRRLYIPEEWIKDEGRREGAGIPKTVDFKTKPQMGLEMIQEATMAGIPYAWVTGDCVYGDYRSIRQWLEENEKCYVMNVSGKEYVWKNFQQKSISSILKSLPEKGWFEASCGDGSKGARVYDWLIYDEINQPTAIGWKRCILVRRSKTKPGELRAYICFALSETSGQKLVEIAGTRWTVETCFKESKSETGLDQYEVRSYEGWYKHITLACIALALITVLSSKSFDTKSIQEHNPAASSLEAFKKGRNLHV
jgi:SRSO17 transposase